MDTILEVKQLEKSFQNRQILKDISFSLKQGENLGIVGESGCGKSTLARMIVRLTESDTGKILLKGREITKAKGKERSFLYEEVQMIFQNPRDSFHPRYKLGTSMMEGMRLKGKSYKEAKERMFHLMEECQLAKEYAERYPHEVSIGECQRAAIVRALALEPSILICDEITSSLDATIQKQMIELLIRLQEEKMTYLFICHDLALVQQFCNRVLIMEAGQIVEQGSIEQIMLAPKTIYTKKLLEASYEW